jgi:hypothetical protein
MSSGLNDPPPRDPEGLERRVQARLQEWNCDQRFAKFLHAIGVDFGRFKLRWALLVLEEAGEAALLDQVLTLPAMLNLPGESAPMWKLRALVSRLDEPDIVERVRAFLAKPVGQLPSTASPPRSHRRRTRDAQDGQNPASPKSSR